MSEELKPCPFCGGEAERHTIGDEEPSNRGGDVICCPDCGASSHVEFGRKENLVSMWNARVTSGGVADPDHLLAVMQAAWSWPCPEGGQHCCCDCDECCDCDRPRSITPDWLNADTCIENLLDTYIGSTSFSEDGPVDTTVSSGDLMVILSLAGAAYYTRAAIVAGRSQ